MFKKKKRVLLYFTILTSESDTAAISLMGIFPLETEIDLRKLTLFGQLCRTNTCTWMKRKFLFRLLSYMAYLYNDQHGFITHDGGSGLRLYDGSDVKL